MFPKERRKHECHIEKTIQKDKCMNGTNSRRGDKEEIDPKRGFIRKLLLAHQEKLHDHLPHEGAAQEVPYQQTVE